LSALTPAFMVAVPSSAQKSLDITALLPPPPLATLAEPEATQSADRPSGYDGVSVQVKVAPVEPLTVAVALGLSAGDVNSPPVVVHAPVTVALSKVPGGVPVRVTFSAVVQTDSGATCTVANMWVTRMSATAAGHSPTTGSLLTVAR